VALEGTLDGRDDGIELTVGLADGRGLAVGLEVGCAGARLGGGVESLCGLAVVGRGLWLGLDVKVGEPVDAGERVDVGESVDVGECVEVGAPLDDGRGLEVGARVVEGDCDDAGDSVALLVEGEIDVEGATDNAGAVDGVADAFTRVGKREGNAVAVGDDEVSPPTGLDDGALEPGSSS
jgi:hypothetical protein